MREPVENAAERLDAAARAVGACARRTRVAVVRPPRLSSPLVSARIVPDRGRAHVPRRHAGRRSRPSPRWAARGDGRQRLGLPLGRPNKETLRIAARPVNCEAHRPAPARAGTGGDPAREPGYLSNPYQRPADPRTFWCGCCRRTGVGWRSGAPSEDSARPLSTAAPGAMRVPFDISDGEGGARSRPLWL